MASPITKDTKWDSLIPSINPGFNPNVSPATTPGYGAVMAAYNGAAFDYATGKFYLCACGGHYAVDNGMYQYDAETLTWSILMQPSSINQSDYLASSALWDAAGFTGGTEPHHSQSWGIDGGYYPPSGNKSASDYVPQPNVWNPPGSTEPYKNTRPVAHHTYSYCCFVPGWGIVNLASDGPKKYDPVAGTASYIDVVPIGKVTGGNPNVPGACSPAINESFTFYDAVTGKVWCGANTGFDYLNLWAYDPTTNNRFGNFDYGQNGLYVWSRMTWTPIYGTRKVFFLSMANYVFWVIDFGTLDVNGKPVATRVYPFEQPSDASFGATGMFSTDYIVDVCHCPELGIVATCTSGRTVTINPDTGAVATLNTSGTAIPRSTMAKPAVDNGTWGRMRYYPNRHAIVFLSTTDENVRVLRVQ
jgi:hypothetical protein